MLRFARSAPTAIVALVLGAFPLAAQIAEPGVTRLQTGSVVAFVAPDRLDGVHVELKAQAGEQRFRCDPNGLAAWVDSARVLVADSPAPSDSLFDSRSVILWDLGGMRGIVLRAHRDPVGGGRQLELMIEDGNEDKLVARTKPDFARLFLDALLRAAPLSGVDSVAFSTGLVEPLLPAVRSDSVWTVNIPMPRYPPYLRAAGVDGLVAVRFLVTTAGSVDRDSIEALWASAPDFVEPTVEALAQARFAPARRNGTPVSRWVYHTVRYHIEGRTPRWQ